MKKVIFALSLISLGLVSVSCSTDAYDLPETEELKVQRTEEQIEFLLEEEPITEENYPNYAAKDGEEESSSSSDNTEPVVKPPKKD